MSSICHEFNIWSTLIWFLWHFILCYKNVGFDAPLHLSYLLSFIWPFFYTILWGIWQSQHNNHTYVWRVRGQCVAQTSKDVGTKWGDECVHTITILYFKQTGTMGEVYLNVSSREMLRLEGRCMLNICGEKSGGYW